MKKIVLTLVAISLLSFAFSQSCIELMISEVVEGSGNNKAFEIYNPTDNDIDLSDYRMVRFSNGSTTSDTDPEYVLDLSGTLVSKDVVVYAVDKRTPADTTEPMTDTALISKVDVWESPVYGDGTPGSKMPYQNGDDALALQRNIGGTWVDVDIYGLIGERPYDNTGTAGTSGAWTDTPPYFSGATGEWWTRNKTNVRRASIDKGVTARGMPYNGAGEFNPTVEWDTLSNDDFSNLGTHNCICSPVGIFDTKKSIELNVYPNPTTTGSFNVATDVTFNSVQVTSIIGEVIFESFESKNNIEVETTNWAIGAYFVKMEFTNGSVGYGKVIVK